MWPIGYGHENNVVTYTYSTTTTSIDILPIFSMYVTPLIIGKTIWSGKSLTEPLE